MTTFDQWRNGEISDERAANALALDLAEVENELAQFNAQREDLRNELSHIVGRLGDRHDVPGFGRIENTAPSVVTSYDREAIEALIVEMAAEGLAEWAQRLARCKKQSSRAGSLRIIREKTKA